MNADAGEMGYGGVMDGKTVSGDLPVDIIGCSSTRRELVALRLAAARHGGKVKRTASHDQNGQYPSSSKLDQRRGQQARLVMGSEAMVLVLRRAQNGM